MASDIFVIVIFCFLVIFCFVQGVRYCQENRPSFKFNRQKRLDNFVVDFYCKQFDLISEVDGEVHEKQKERDSERDNILEVKHNLKVVIMESSALNLQCLHFFSFVITKYKFGKGMFYQVLILPY